MNNIKDQNDYLVWTYDPARKSYFNIKGFEKTKFTITEPNQEVIVFMGDQVNGRYGLDAFEYKNMSDKEIYESMKDIERKYNSETK